jgi:hypothetical protein
MGASVASKMLGPDGQKTLAPSGATVVAQQFTADPIALGRIATGLLDVLPVKVQPTAEYAFMRQTTRTNNAAVVAEGAVKPTTALSVTRVEQSLQVVTHLSEGVPRFWLLDNIALEEFVDAELSYGLGWRSKRKSSQISTAPAEFRRKPIRRRCLRRCAKASQRSRLALLTGRDCFASQRF